MPFCTKCGFPASETEKYCSKCGTLLNNALFSLNHTTHSMQGKKINFSTGALLGSGVAMLCTGLIVAYFLDSFYWQLTNYLESNQLQVNIYASGIDNLILFISACGLVTITGIFVLAMGFLNFSDKARFAMSLKNDGSRVGRGLITGGFVATSLFFLNLIREQYLPIASNVIWYMLIPCLVGGLIAILVGALLIRRSYLRSLAATKV